MGLFDGPAAAAFLHDAQGRTLIRPWGRWGKTYLVAPERQLHLTRFLRRFYATMLVIVVAATLALPMGYAFGLLPLVLGIYYVSLWRFTRRLPSVESSPVETSRDLQARYAHAAGRPILWFTVVVSTLFVAGGIWMPSLGEARTGWLTAGFFALCLLSAIRQLWLTRT